MKHILVAIMLLFLAFAAQTQIQEEVKVELSDPSETGLLKIHIHNGSIDITGHNEDYVLIQYKSRQKKESAKTLGSLKKIPNTAINMEITEFENTVEIESDNNRTDYEIWVPYDLNINASSHHNSDIVVNNVIGEIELQSHHGSIEIHDVGGSVSADTHHGRIFGSFKSFDSSKPMAFSTYHGDIELTFPPSLNCNTKMKSDKGDIYTDFDLEVEPVKPTRVNNSGHNEIKIGGWIYGSIGSGGKEFMFTTYHGDIIIRKS